MAVRVLQDRWIRPYAARPQVAPNRSLRYRRSAVRGLLERPMPALVRLVARGPQHDAPISGRDDPVARHVHVDRKQPAGAHQQVVREDGVDPPEQVTIAREDLPADLRGHRGPFVHAPTVADWLGPLGSGTAIDSARWSTSIRSGNAPNGSPSRCARVARSPSRRATVARTNSTAGWFTWRPR